MRKHLRIGKKNFTEKKKTIIRKLYAEGMIIADIARTVNRSWSGIYGVLYPKKIQRPKQILTAEQKKRKYDATRDWSRRNPKRVKIMAMKAQRRYRKKLKAKKLEHNKHILLETAKRLGLYEVKI